MLWSGGRVHHDTELGGAADGSAAFNAAPKNVSARDVMGTLFRGCQQFFSVAWRLGVEDGC